mgnify:CR=1 FL=1
MSYIEFQDINKVQYEIVRMLADRGVEDPKAVIDSVLAL